VRCAAAGGGGRHVLSRGDGSDAQMDDMLVTGRRAAGKKRGVG
jgi:hypothetical protein